MRSIRTFREWLIHGEPEVLTKSKIYIEDLSGNQKRTKISELQKLLKDYDFYFGYHLHQEEVMLGLFQ